MDAKRPVKDMMNLADAAEEVVQRAPHLFRCRFNAETAPDRLQRRNEPEEGEQEADGHKKARQVAIKPRTIMEVFQIEEAGRTNAIAQDWRGDCFVEN